MKTHLLTSMVLVLILHISPKALMATSILPSSSDEMCCKVDEKRLPVQFVITEKRVWVISEEVPLGNFDLKIYDSEGKVCLEKRFCATSCERMFVDFSHLPVGTYRVEAVGVSAELIRA